MVRKNKYTSFPRGLHRIQVAETRSGLSIHHHRNMPPAVYIVVAVLGAVATGYALKEVRSRLLASNLTHKTLPHNGRSLWIIL